MFRHVDLHIFCSSYTKMFVGKDPSTTGGIFYGMEVGWVRLSVREVSGSSVWDPFPNGLWVWVRKTYGTNFDLDLSGPRSKVSNKTIFNLKKV